MNIPNRKKILGDMITWMRNESSEITDFSDGSPQRAILNSNARQIHLVYYRLKRVYKGSRLLDAQGTDLDAIVLGRGIRRYGKTKAGVTVVLSGSNGTNVPRGTQISSPDGITYSTIESGTVAGGTLSLSSEADNPGVASRVRAGKLTIMISVVAGIDSVTNPYSSTGGYDYEEDEQLRNRAMVQLSTEALGVPASYEAWAREAYEDVLRAKAEGNPVGYPKGYVKVHIISRSGAALSAGTLTAIQEYIVRKAPATEGVIVVNVSYTQIAVSAEIRLESGFSLVTVQDTVEDNLQNYLDWRYWDWGRDVQFGDLFALVNNSAGVNDVIAATFSPSSNVEVKPYSIPKLASSTMPQTSQARPLDYRRFSFQGTE